MARAIIIFCLGCLLFSCKKDGGKHCPLIQHTQTGHLVDISPVDWIPSIKDTLLKYPQLQVYRVIFNEGPTQDNHSAIVNCHIYYQGLRIINTSYYLHYSSFSGIKSSPQPPPHPIAIGSIPISLIPAITVDEAIVIAENTMDYTYCSIAELGLSYLGTGAVPGYKLVWRVEGIETGYPVVELDAQLGTVIYSDDGIRH